MRPYLIKNALIRIHLKKNEIRLCDKARLKIFFLYLVVILDK